MTKPSKAFSKNALTRRIRAAQGLENCDLILSGVTYLDVFQCRWAQGDLAVCDGIVVGVEPGLRAKRVWDGRGKWVAPGFLDAHVHVESSMMTPRVFAECVLPRGTTTAVCDPHEIANVLGARGIKYFLESAAKLPLDLWVMLSSCVPATGLETNGGGEIPASMLAPLRKHPRALGLAEMMNVPGVLGSDPGVLRKLLDFQGSVIDGHSPLLRGKALSAYLTSGITSCHESSELEEAREKISKGMSVWIREGSVAKDLSTLIPLLTPHTSTTLGFCTDDRNPLDILEEGHVDHLVRSAIRHGVAPELAYRTASWSAARHYGLDRVRVSPNGARAERVGAIAPGYAADFVVLNDAASVDIHGALKAGRWASELAYSRALPMPGPRNSVFARLPEERDLQGPAGRVHVIEVLTGKIITARSVLDSDAPGVARLSVLERHGSGLKPANAYVRGFGAGLNGAIASSVGHDSHNLIVAGSNTRDMRVALGALIKSGGGFAVTQNGKVLAQLDLPLAGLMCDRSPEELKTKLLALKDASRAISCELADPFLQLAFLSLPVIPALKLTDLGLVDVALFKIIPVAA